jgi:hypothetical protein
MISLDDGKFELSMLPLLPLLPLRRCRSRTSSATSF